MDAQLGANSPTQSTVFAGRYVMARKLAEGGTGAVFLGWDKVDGAWRAIKLLLPEYADRPAILERFRREVDAMRRIEHPNVVAVLDHGTAGGEVYMAIEFAEGGSVNDWMRRNGPMPPRMAVAVCIDLCAGVAAAHAKNILHRDIKPQNLLITRGSICKVTDFGIAQATTDMRMTQTGAVMGTVGYMAPEQHDSAKHTDERSDVFSIAATLYALLTGEPAQHLFMSKDKDFNGIPESLRGVIQRGAQYRREERYGSVRELMVALTKASASLGDIPKDCPGLYEPMVPYLDQLAESFLGNVPEPEVTPPSLPGGRLLLSPPSNTELRPYSQGEKRRPIGIYAAGALMALGFLCIALASLGHVQVAKELRDVSAARAAYLRVLSEERSVVDELDELGSTADLGPLFTQLESRTGEPAMALAGRIQMVLEREARLASQDAAANKVGVVKQVEQRAQRIDAAARAYREAQSGEQAARKTLPGAIASIWL